MPRKCEICIHPDHSEINKELIKGTSYRDISRRFDTSADSLYRHKQKHIPSKLVKAQEIREVVKGDDLLNQLRDLHTKALNILSKAERKKDFRAATSAIREVRGCIELQAKLLGELNTNPVVNILVSQDWIKMRSLIVKTLEPYPEARKALIQSMEKIELGSNHQ